MSKIDISKPVNGDITVSPATCLPVVLSRPRCAVRHLIGRLNLRYVARITAQVITSASLIVGGITVGLNPIGAFLAFTGFCLAFPLDEVESDEEYRQLVIAHFEERGKKPPWWTCQGGAR